MADVLHVSDWFHADNHVVTLLLLSTQMLTCAHVLGMMCFCIVTEHILTGF